MAAVHTDGVGQEEGHGRVRLGQLQALGAGEGEAQERPGFAAFAGLAHGQGAIESVLADRFGFRRRPPEGALRAGRSNPEAERPRQRHDAWAEDAEIGVRRKPCLEAWDVVPGFFGAPG